MLSFGESGAKYVILLTFCGLTYSYREQQQAGSLPGAGPL
jgi:hypothetical protein